MLSNVVLCVVLSPTISPLLDIILPKNETRVRYLAFELNYGIDLQTYWFWLWLHVCLTAVFVMLNYTAADIMYVTLMLHGCYMFAIVRYRLEQLTHSIKKNTIQPFENRDYNTMRTWQCKERQVELQKQVAAMKQCVLRHEKAIKCAQVLYHIFAWSLFAGASINVIMISISAVQLVSKLSQWGQMAIACVFVAGELVHIFFLSLMAQYILDHSVDVHESAFSCSWYNMSVKVQKDIILILMRSRLPCKMMAGKYFVMSLESFCAIVQTSMSYFTMLASFR
ncbi:odorant receptor 13a-like [Odontomachus brunneus]|uniref:odorant receptor 13a-like n=1 Tax=Odontomachus brunneus TaxID=486640 RepID=UPI0013F189F2|nr:odorant receptor 13a-like [Odontomachus brunneus]